MDSEDYDVADYCVRELSFLNLFSSFSFLVTYSHRGCSSALDLHGCSGVCGDFLSKKAL